MTCESTKKCSCEDAGLHTICPVCNPVDCPEPNPCSEIFSDQCIIHTGNTVSAPDGSYDIIKQGDTLSDFIQKLVITPDCKETAALNIHSITVTTTSIRVGWVIQGVPDTLELQYSLDAIVWLTNPAVTPPTSSDIIGPALTPDTDYFIKVVSTTGLDVCDSAIIKVKTNSLT